MAWPPRSWSIWAVSLNKVRSAVEFIIGHGEATTRGEVGLSPGAKRVIELAIDEARYIGHNYIGTEHLLLGLLREGEGIAARVLDSLGVTLEKVRAEITKVQEQGVSRPKAARAPSRTPALDQLGIDLTASARAGKLDPVIGRSKEIERIIQILSRRTKNNPALIGEPGVGKTAIVEGLALRERCGGVSPLAPAPLTTILWYWHVTPNSTTWARTWARWGLS